MDVQTRSIAILALLSALALGACSARLSGPGGATVGPTDLPLSSVLATLEPPTAAPTIAPASNPPTSSASPDAQIQVTSPEQAAALVFASNPLFSSIKAHDAAVVGESSSYEVAETGDAYAVSVTMGSGDCPSGCINKHTWNYTVDSHGAVSLVSEHGDEIDAPINHGTTDPATVTVRLVAGPTCAVETMSPDPNCEPRVIAGAYVILRDPSGAEVARGESGTDGIVTMSVPGGAYYTESESVASMMGQAQAEAFSVPGGESVTITLEYDTGIR